MKITILQQNEYPNDRDDELSIKNHLTFLTNSHYYITKWGIFNRQTEERISEKLEEGVITNFRYDYETN